MIKTVYVGVAMMIYLLVTFVFLLPIATIITLVSKRNGIAFSKKVAKNWGRYFVWLTGNKVEVILKDEKIFEQIKNEPVVIVSNHQSNLDIPLVLGYLEKPVGFVAKKEMETWPIIGIWMKNIQCVFLDRKDPRKGIESMREAAGKIKNGYSIVIFPEGTRTETGEIGEFKKGSFKLATDAGVKIVPVTIKGTYDVWRKGNKKINKIEKIKLIVDMPVEIAGLERDAIKEMPERIKAIIEQNLKSDL